MLGGEGRVKREGEGGLLTVFPERGEGFFERGSLIEDLWYITLETSLFFRLLLTGSITDTSTILHIQSTEKVKAINLPR